jgi:DNA-binding beta-propeller fold protein YncE
VNLPQRGNITSLRGLRVAGATLITLCLAWCCSSCSPAGSRLSSSPPGVASARPGQLWASTLPGVTSTVPGEAASIEAVSPDGSTLFVTGGYGTRHFETVAYRAATGARLWAKSYQGAGRTYTTAITVSPDGARVYLTGVGDTSSALGEGGATIAYDARTGTQLWVHRYKSKGSYLTGLAVSPDGTTLYVTGSRGLGKHAEFGLIAYVAATGKQRWLRYYTKVPGYAASIAVSPDGKTVYATGLGRSSVVTVAYHDTGTLKWATRYNNPYAGGAAGGQIVAGPGGTAVYVIGTAANKYGHYDYATFAYSAATGKKLWLDRYNALAGPSPFVGAIRVTPDGRTVVVTGSPNEGRTGGYLIAAYNASTGATRWARRAPASRYAPTSPAGLVIGPHGTTVYVASSQLMGGYDAAAWSVTHGTVLWRISYAAAKVYLPAAIALSADGTRLFVTGSVGRNASGITTVAYQP